MATYLPCRDASNQGSFAKKTAIDDIQMEGLDHFVEKALPKSFFVIRSVAMALDSIKRLILVRPCQSCCQLTTDEAGQWSLIEAVSKGFALTPREPEENEFGDWRPRRLPLRSM